jgi:hypothetical protein
MPRLLISSLARAAVLAPLPATALPEGEHRALVEGVCTAATRPT